MTEHTDTPRYIVRAALCWGSSSKPEEALLIALRNRPEGLGPINENEFAVVRTRGTATISDMGTITSDDPEAAQLTAKEAFGFDTFAEAALSAAFTALSDVGRAVKRLSYGSVRVSNAYELIDRAEYLLDDTDPADLNFDK